MKLRRINPKRSRTRNQEVDNVPSAAEEADQEVDCQGAVGSGHKEVTCDLKHQGKEQMQEKQVVRMWATVYTCSQSLGEGDIG